MKNIKYLLLVIILCAAAYFAYVYNSSMPKTEMKSETTFSGKLEEVNTGCFADGECYVVIGGKHVTAIMGWSQETVGQVLGLKENEGFGDLEKHLGHEMEVFAKEVENGKYTLYGNENYYIKMK